MFRGPYTHHDHGLWYVLFESAATKQGPFSDKAPIRDEPPGPPLSQIASGALRGSFLDSKNQKKLVQVSLDSTYYSDSNTAYVFMG